MPTTELDQSPDSLLTESSSPSTPDFEELDDGSVLIPDEQEESVASSNFGENLAEILDKVVLNQLATDLEELLEHDAKAREERDKQQEEGIRRTGLGNDAPGGAAFSGASKVVHPVLAEGCVDFSARAIKELFPANGPIKTKIYGKSNEDKLEKARHKRDFLNWYTTRKMQEYRSEKEILLTQLPLGGSQYEKYWYDGDRIRMEFVPIDKVLLPFSANSFYTAQRVTHLRDVTEEMVRTSVEDKFYVDVFSLTDKQLDTTASQKATEKVEGKEDSGYNEDGIRTVYEVTCDWDIEGKGVAPYVIHMDKSTTKIAAIYRNWKEDDERKERLDWWVEDKFIPWRGAYGIGLPHLIGGLAAALTGALRALLDSAHINNVASAIKLKGARASGQNVNLEVTAVTEIEAPAGVDDIRKIMMPMPFNPPSTVLFQLLDWLTNQAKGVVATAEERIADAGNNMPVGTTLALIEQGSMTFSSIHARLHDSQRKALAIICRLIADYPEHIEEDLKRFELTSSDFIDNEDIEPVSDPNIFSESQRYAQLQEQLKVMGMFPNLQWDQAQIARRALELLRTDDIDSILPKDESEVSGNPLVENAAAMRNVKIKITHDQNHSAHIKTHLDFIISPFGGLNPLTPPQGLAQLLTHAQEHINAEYLRMVQQFMQQAIASGIPEDSAAEQAQKQMLMQYKQSGEQLTQEVAQAMKIVMERQPKPPTPPEVTASLEIAKMDTERKTQLDKTTSELKQHEMQASAALDAAKHQAAQMQQQFEQWLAQAQEQSKVQIAAQNLASEQMRAEMQQQAEIFKNEADNKQHQLTELLKNRGDNETALQLKMMELQSKMEEGFAQGQVPTPQSDGMAPMLQEMQGLLGQIEKAKTGDALQTIMESLHGMMAHMAAPTEVIRDPKTGKAIGMRKTQIQIQEGVE